MKLGAFVRVTVLEHGKQRSFWAGIMKRGALTTLYTPVTKEGNDKSYIDKKTLSYIIPGELIANRLIISEKPATLDKKYGWLVVSK
jgi:hypothetical protein